tara:strand:- start:385 stop:657 length:273 start_codon:yes stop_codon:yes gene_type:complete
MYIRENSYIENLLNQIKNNTHNNLHSENVMLITSNFGNDIQKEECFEILQDHKKKKELLSITSTARKYLLKEVLNSMENKKLSNKINSIL